MRVFKVLDDKSIIKADSRLFWTPIFSTIPLLGEFAISPSVFEQPIRQKFYC